MCQGCTSETAAPGENIAPMAAESATPVVYCDGCDTQISAGGGTTETRDGTVCDACAETFGTCDECEEFVPNEEIQNVTVRTEVGRRIDRELCEACRASLSECDDCGHHVHQDHARNINDRAICPSCADHYFQCDSCTDEYHNDDYGGDGLCQSCYDEREAESRGPIMEYSYNVLDRLSHLGPRAAIKYGVELEVEAPRGDRLELAEAVIDALGDDFAVLKEDGSLDSGFEIVSAPATAEIHHERWEGLFTWHAKRSALRSYDTSTCGMHVHISREGLTQLQIGRMLVFLHNPDNAEFVQKIAQRDPSQWASCRAKKKYADAKCRDGDRYVALNLRPRHTVELRIFKGTLKRESFYKNLEFAAALVAFTAPAERSLTDAGRSEEFVRFVRKNRKAYPHLDDFLVARGWLPKRQVQPQKEIPLCA